MVINAFITFIDDCKKSCYLYLLKGKEKAIEKNVLYKNEIENKVNKKIKELRTNRGSKYVVPF